MAEITPEKLNEEVSKQIEETFSGLFKAVIPNVTDKLQKQMITLFSSSLALYNQMLESGVAKECARFVLPLATPTRLYMTGSCRSWIHYINLRSAHGTQKEHMDIANACKGLFIEHYPVVSEALDWTK